MPWVRQVELVASATRQDQFPEPVLPEFAFLGRSNVGKSALLNALLHPWKPARVSSKPGCTRWVNFYRVDGRLCLVDLPGYGYARVPAEEQQRWKGLIERYLRFRPALRLSFLLLDARRGWQEPDRQLRQWLEYYRKPFVVVATKVDQWETQREKERGQRALAEEARGLPLVLFSARTGQGVKEIWQIINGNLNRVTP